MQVLSQKVVKELEMGILRLFPAFRAAPNTL